jgi:hypothetical protein
VLAELVGRRGARAFGYAAGDKDYMFALYLRDGVFAYARLRGQTTDKPAHMRLILGVLREQGRGDE